MKVTILKTDGGPHSPGKWATATAGQIIEIASGVDADQESEGRKLELQIIDILENYHGIVARAEQTKLHETDHDFGPLDVGEHVYLDKVVSDVCEAGKQTRWVSHFENPEVVAHIRHVIGTDFATSMQIERFYYADRNPDHEKAKAYKDQYHKGGFVS